MDDRDEDGRAAQAPAGMGTAQVSERPGPQGATAWARALPAVLLVAALAYLLPALWVMLLAPKVPYADAWRFQAHLLSTPFPASVLAPDNGHHELLPGLVRLAELHWLGGGQWLQIAVGIALLLATLALGWRQTAGLPAMPRRAAWLALVLGLCWLGNERALGHANETVHAYAVTVLLLAGIGLLARAAGGTRQAWLAGLCAMAAAFSFGSGIAVFGALFAVLWLVRARAAAWWAVGACLLVTGLALQASGGSQLGPMAAPLRALVAWWRWLGGPWIYAAWPAFDPDLAARLPQALHWPLLPLARAYHAQAGAVMLAWFPQALLGLAGLAALAPMAWRARQRPSAAACLGIGLAVFAACAGVLIAVVRDGYFVAFPDQLLAPRYLVWSSLFWSGLVLAGVALWPARRTTLLVLAVAVVLLPSQAWMGRLAASMREVAMRTATAAVVNVIDPAEALGESVPAEIGQALPLQRQARVAMFAWPHAGLLGHRVQAQPLPATAVQVEPLQTLAGTPARRVRFVLEQAPAQRVLLVDADGVARGLAIPDRRAGAGHWIGWMDAAGTAPPVVAAAR